MARQFETALLGALALHVVLVASSGLLPDTVTRSAPTPAWPEDEVLVLLDDSGGELRPSPGLDEHRPPPLAARDTTSARLAYGQSASLQADARADDHEPIELDSGAVVESSPPEPRRPINLGLDGSIARAKLLDQRDRPLPRRPVVALDLWSESALRSAAETAAPREGSALLTIAWDATGKLQSIASSAQSSNQESWQRFAAALRKKLDRRPGGASRGSGLRLVYLIKSEVVAPGDKRSLLPAARYASAEQIKDELLPPASIFNLGVKADSGPGSERVITITLTSSQAL